MENFLTACKSWLQAVPESYNWVSSGLSQLQEGIAIKLMPSEFPINPKITCGMHYKLKRGFHFRGPPDPSTILREQSSSLDSYVQLFKGMNLKPGSMERTNYEHFFEELSKSTKLYPKGILNGELQSVIYWCQKNNISYRFPRSDMPTAEFINQILLNMQQQSQAYEDARFRTNVIIFLLGLLGLSFIITAIYQWLNYSEDNRTSATPEIEEFILTSSFEPLTNSYFEFYQFFLLSGTVLAGLAGLYFFCYTLFKFRNG